MEKCFADVVPVIGAALEFQTSKPTKSTAIPHTKVNLLMTNPPYQDIQYTNKMRRLEQKRM